MLGRGDERSGREARRPVSLHIEHSSTPCLTSRSLRSHHPEAELILATSAPINNTLAEHTTTVMRS